ncbi:hypothetical protein F4810DRAFT_695773 [Camillea tinctor]|nr:hypothetical protein F4810DRAFT_695773 [Camillea tinctor]
MTDRSVRATRNVNTRASSRATSDKALHTDDPEKILRNDRKALRAQKEKAKSASIQPYRRPHHYEQPRETIETTSQEHISDNQGVNSNEEASYRLHQYDEYDEYDDSLEEDPQDTYYIRVGYLPPLSEDTIELLNILDPNEIMVDKAARLSSGTPLFRTGLQARNVIFKNELEDPLTLDLSAVSELGAQEEEMFQDRLWDADVYKTKEDSQEFVFQRTLMMSLIDRFRLLYPHRRILDFTVEKLWNCPPMPSAAGQQHEPKLLSRPKVDITIAFRTAAFFPDINMLPDAFKEVMNYEGTGDSYQMRAFHFMAVEAKRPGDDGLNVAFAQILNAASQSLHNMYCLFREADSGDQLTTSMDGKHVKTFFEKVRFFSVACSREIMIIRVHRACLIDDDDESAMDTDELPGIGTKARSFNEDYKLQFRHYTWKKLKNGGFTRQTAVAELDKIINDYGVNKLFPCLKEATDAVQAKCLQYRSVHNKVLPRVQRDYNHMDPSVGMSRASTRQPSTYQSPTPSTASKAKKRKR